jgi:hypothetical protein
LRSPKSPTIFKFFPFFLPISLSLKKTKARLLNLTMNTFFVDTSSFQFVPKTYADTSRPLQGKRDEYVLYNAQKAAHIGANGSTGSKGPRGHGEMEKPMAVRLPDGFEDIVKQIVSSSPNLADKIVVFASVINARHTSDSDSTAKDMDYHTDAKENTPKYVRTLTYLTDVDDIKNGPIAFFTGPVLGKTGTTVSYESNVPHKGLKNTSDKDRLALTLIFMDKNIDISTLENFDNWSGMGEEETCYGDDCLFYCSGRLDMLTGGCTKELAQQQCTEICEDIKTACTKTDCDYYCSHNRTFDRYVSGLQSGCSPWIAYDHCACPGDQKITAWTVVSIILGASIVGGSAVAAYKMFKK